MIPEGQDSLLGQSIAVTLIPEGRVSGPINTMLLQEKQNKQLPHTPPFPKQKQTPFHLKQVFTTVDENT